MPVTIQLTIADEDVAKFAAAILGGANPELTTATVPVDKAAKAPKGAKAAPAKAPEPEPEPENEDAATTDLVTDAQIEAANSTAEAAEEGDMRAQLTDFYISCGMSKKDTQNVLASMSVDELRAGYLDYLARLVKDEDGDFVSDFTTFYKATRVNDGAETVSWAKAGVTIQPDEYAANELEDPNAKPKAAAPKKPGLPTRKK